MPDQKWLLDALSALNAGHDFFMKSYTPDRPQDPYLQWKLQQIGTCSSVQHDLFRDLPPSLLVKRKSLKSMAPSTAQPQVSTFRLNLSMADLLLLRQNRTENSSFFDMNEEDSDPSWDPEQKPPTTGACGRKG